MGSKQPAEEHLKVIRELMERATTYRILSTTTACFGALATLLAGIWSYSKGNEIWVGKFVCIWVGVYLLVDLVNTVLLFKDSKERQAEFPSAKLMHAVVAMIPAIIAGGVISLVFAFVHEDPVRCATIWVVFSGISLLATSSFAPRSIICLGWAFLGSGLALFFWKETGKFLPGDNSVSQASFVMMITYGLWLTLYAIWTGIISKKSDQ